MEIEIDDFTLNQHIERLMERQINHCDDFAPGMHFRLKSLGHDFRTLDYVKAQCAKLAAQLASE